MTRVVRAIPWHMDCIQRVYRVYRVYPVGVPVGVSKCVADFAHVFRVSLASIAVKVAIFPFIGEKLAIGLRSLLAALLLAKIAAGPCFC